MKCLAYFREQINIEKGFTLLEMLLVIIISSLLAAIFLQLIFSLYQNNNFFNLQSSWQLDGYLAVDFMISQIKNAKKVEIINQQEIDIYSYYDQEYQWLKFNLYQSRGNNALGRIIGSTVQTDKDFGRNLALLDNIDDLCIEIVEPGLLKLSLFLKQGQKKLTISRLIKI